MAQKPVFGLHTAEFKRWITKKEALSIKKYFNLNPEEKLTDETYFYQDGITKIWLEEIQGKKPRYYLHVIINFARALKASGYKIMPYTTGNVKKVFTAINKILKKLPLCDSNAVFPEWTAVRFDSAFDIYEEHTALLMQLLNRSVNLSDRKKRCKRIPIQGKTPQETECQSMRFGNNSFTYNIYRKLEEIQDKGKAITEEEKAEVQHLLRIERQNHQDAVKKLLPNMKASDLADAKVHNNILNTMIDEMKIFFGNGDFYSCREIDKKFYPDHISDIFAIKKILKYITLNSLEAAQEQKAYTKEISGIFDKLKLSPAGIRQQFGIDFIRGIYSRLTAEFPRPPDKRQYNIFPMPCVTRDGRHKADITLYRAGSGRKKISVAGKTLADYESKVLYKLEITYLANTNIRYTKDDTARQTVLKSADSILRFYKTAKTKEVRTDAEQFIKTFNLDNHMESDTVDSQ